MDFKKIVVIIGAMFILFALAACGDNEASEAKDGDGEANGDYEELMITFSHNQPLESPEHAGAEKFKEVIEEESNGKITVDMYPNSQLGSLREQVEGTQVGEIDISMQPSAVITPFVDDIKVIDLPYLFPPDNNQKYEVLDSDAGTAVLDTLEDGGFKGLGFWPGGFKLLTTGKKEIHKPEDLKGLSMRVMDSKVLIDQFELWGANPVPVPYAEVYNSLQQGVVDGQENPLQTVFLNNYHEVQDYIIETYHGTMTYILIANQPWFEALPENTQALIKEAEEAGRKAARESLEDTEDEYRDEIDSSDATFYQFTDEEIEEFTKISEPLHEKAYGEPHQLEILEQLKEEIDKVTD